MARLLVVSDVDPQHVVILDVDDDAPTAHCDRHPDYFLHENNRYSLADAYQEAARHVDHS